MAIKDRLGTMITALMADPQAARPLSTAGLLQGAGRLFGHLVKLRDRGYRSGLFKTHRLPVTVISIGNITTGGTGKTPMTLYTAKLLRRFGYRVTILSRGYKGGAEKKGGIVSDGIHLLMPPEAAGDEPFMMARFLGNIPVLVGRNRVASGHLAISRFSPDIILLDDGFQHRRLHRDLDIVLLDSSLPYGNRFLLPRGSLREPPDALTRADAIVFTRWHDDLPEPTHLLPESARSLPRFKSRHVPYIHTEFLPASGSSTAAEIQDLSQFAGIRVFAFSAIADNKDFHRVLENLGCRIAGTAEFADHHAYTSHGFKEIVRKAVAAEVKCLVTTQKDLSKLPPDMAWPLPLVVLGVLPSFTGKGNEFDDFLKSAVLKAMARRNC